MAAVLVGMSAFISCRKDLSTYDTNPVPGVSIDTTGMHTLAVFQFENLIINPKLSFNGADESRFTYQWKMNLAYNDTASVVLSNSKNLNAEIRVKPNLTNQYHTLVFTATDKENGLQYITNWRLTVRNSIGEGLVIAETAEGINTDLSHIMSPLVTPQYNAESIKRNVYSAINKETIPGIVKQMRFTGTTTGNTLFAITDNSLTKVKTLDYTFGGRNDDLFYSPSGTYSFQALSGRNQGDLFIENGKLTSAYLGITAKIGLPYDITVRIPSIFAINRMDNPDVAFNFYEEVSGKFMYIPSVNTLAFSDHKAYAYASQPAAVFNPGSLPNKTNLGAGLGAEDEFVHVLKDKTSGKINMYVFDKGGFDYDNFVVIPPAPKATFDISSAPGINEATQFLVLDNQRVMYYATSTKIYAVLYGSSTAVVEERYTVPAGETMTTLQVYQQSNYPWGTSFLPTNNKQLIMSTYGGAAGTGKVYILPMVNLGLGNIDQANIKTFTGFNRITAITTQK